MSRTSGQSSGPRSNLTGAYRTSAHRLKYKKGTTKILWTDDFWIFNIPVYSDFNNPTVMTAVGDTSDNLKKIKQICLTVALPHSCECWWRTDQDGPSPQEITHELDYKEKEQERKNCKATSVEISLVLQLRNKWSKTAAELCWSQICYFKPVSDPDLNVKKERPDCNYSKSF